MMTKTPVATEGGHWYGRDGTPTYTIERSRGGGFRPTTLRDARQRNLLPSVTGIIRILDKPGLTRWLQEKRVEAAWALRDQAFSSYEEYSAAVNELAARQSEDARESGTLIHGLIEQGLQGRPIDQDVNAHLALPAIAWVERNLTGCVLRAEHSFASRYGYGGKTDLAAESSTRQVIVDFKTTDKPLAGLSCYDEHDMQLAACAVGVFGNHAGVECGIMYVSTAEPEVRMIWREPEEISRGFRMFEAALDLWRHQKGYDPRF